MNEPDGTLSQLSLGRMLEALATCGGFSEHVPAVPAIDPLDRMKITEMLVRRGWIEAVTMYGGNGRLVAAHNLQITPAGEKALKDLRATAGRTASVDAPAVPLEEKRERRLTLMQRLYDLTGGCPMVGVDVYEMGTPLGWDRGATDDVAGYLEAEGLLEYIAMEGLVGITHKGVVEVEQVRRDPDQPTEHFSPVINIMSVGSMNSSQIQQGTDMSTQGGSFVTGESSDSIRQFLAALKADLPEVDLDEVDRSELNAEMLTIETQLASSRPKRPTIKSSLACIAAVLGRATVLTGSAVDLVLHIDRLHQMIPGI